MLAVRKAFALSPLNRRFLGQFGITDMHVPHSGWSGGISELAGGGMRKEGRTATRAPACPLPAGPLCRSVRRTADIVPSPWRRTGPLMGGVTRADLFRPHLCEVSTPRNEGGPRRGGALLGSTPPGTRINLSERRLASLQRVSLWSCGERKPPPCLLV